MTIQQFNNKFPDNTACLSWLFNERFGKPQCPKCGKVNKYHQQSGSSHFVCVCGAHQLSPKKDTIFEKSDTDLYKWFFALHLFSVSKNGVSAKELQRQLGVTYKCAWRIANQIRKLFSEHGLTLSGTIEADETYVGGRTHGVRGRGAKHKTVVFGMVERQGNIKAEVVKNVRASILLPIVHSSVEPDSKMMTDDLPSYNKVQKLGLQHNVVRHSLKEYARGNVHTNTIEGFWSQLKRSIDGTYHAVSPKHLHAYVDEFSWRYNRRKMPSVFDALMAVVARRV